MKKNKRWIYIPVETKVRELHGKLLLACLAASKGVNVILGAKTEINSRSAVFPPGAVFNVGLAQNLAQNARKFKKEGHKVVAIDEEGISILREELYLDHRLSNETLDLTDTFFCWGKYHKSIIEKKAKKDSWCKLIIAGNPRFDMLRPEYKGVFSDEVEAIKKKYGKIILINTNFGFGNHYIGENFLIDSLKKRGWMDKRDNRQYFMGYVDWQKKLYQEFKNAIGLLSETFPEYSIIVRPHPSENHQNWKKMAEKYRNVYAIHSGNVIPWLIAAEVLIHNGCTTAIEANFLGTPSIAFRPVIVKDMEAKLPNEVSVETYRPEELILTLKKILDANKRGKNPEQRDLSYYISGFNGQTASQAIANSLISSIPSGGEISRFRLAFFEAVNFLKKSVIKLANRNENTDDSKYLLHKTPDIKEIDISGIIKKLSRIHPEFSDLSVRHVSGNCFHIYKE